MDFGVDLDDLGSYGSSEVFFTEEKGYGSSEFLLQQGKVLGSVEGDAKSLQMGPKMARKDHVLGTKPMIFETKPNLLRPNSFLSVGSSPLPKLECANNSNSVFQGTSLSPFHPSPCTKMSGTRGPFTPSQWLELEHQALIFKYMSTGVPVPHNLSLPLRKSLNHAFCAFPAGSLRNNPWWGSFRIGFSGSLDPEPGRCRRTDGKKWRCARDAAPDQKYCERHLNRGRHRSRKPVEGQIGHGNGATGSTSASKAVSAAAPLKAAPVCTSVPDYLPISQHQIKTFQSSADSTYTANSRHGLCGNKPDLQQNQVQNVQNGSLLSSTNLRVGDSISCAGKQQFPFKESTRAQHDFVSSDSCPQRKSDSNKHLSFSSDPCTKEPRKPQSLHHFIDQWRNNLQSEKTQFLIPVPVSSPDIVSSSPATHSKHVLSESKSVPEHTMPRMPMCLGMGTYDGSLPISWKTSPGGPLAEVLNLTSPTAMTSRADPDSSSQPYGSSSGSESHVPTLTDCHFSDINIWINVQRQCKERPPESSGNGLQL